MGRFEFYLNVELKRPVKGQQTMRSSGFIPSPAGGISRKGGSVRFFPALMHSSGIFALVMGSAFFIASAFAINQLNQASGHDVVIDTGAWNWLGGIKVGLDHSESAPEVFGPSALAKPQEFPTIFTKPKASRISRTLAKQSRRIARRAGVKSGDSVVATNQAIQKDEIRQVYAKPVAPSVAAATPADPVVSGVPGVPGVNDEAEKIRSLHQFLRGRFSQA